MPISALTMSHRGVNQFKEEWLKKTDSNGDVINSYSAELGDFHVKCNWCKADISFSNLGFTAIKRHSEIVLSQAFFTLLPHLALTHIGNDTRLVKICCTIWWNIICCFNLVIFYIVQRLPVSVHQIVICTIWWIDLADFYHQIVKYQFCDILQCIKSVHMSNLLLCSLSIWWGLHQIVKFHQKVSCDDSQSGDFL